MDQTTKNQESNQNVTQDQNHLFQNVQNANLLQQFTAQSHNQVQPYLATRLGNIQVGHGHNPQPISNPQPQFQPNTFYINPVAALAPTVRNPNDAEQFEKQIYADMLDQHENDALKISSTLATMICCNSWQKERNYWLQNNWDQSNQWYLQYCNDIINNNSINNGYVTFQEYYNFLDRLNSELYVPNGQLINPMEICIDHIIDFFLDNDKNEENVHIKYFLEDYSIDNPYNDEHHSYLKHIKKQQLFHLFNLPEFQVIYMDNAAHQDAEKQKKLMKIIYSHDFSKSIMTTMDIISSFCAHSETMIGIKGGNSEQSQKGRINYIGKLSFSQAFTEIKNNNLPNSYEEYLRSDKNERYSRLDNFKNHDLGLGFGPGNSHGNNPGNNKKHLIKTYQSLVPWDENLFKLPAVFKFLENQKNKNEIFTKENFYDHLVDHHDVVRCNDRTSNEDNCDYENIDAPTLLDYLTSGKIPNTDITAGSQVTLTSNGKGYTDSSVMELFNFVTNKLKHIKDIFNNKAMRDYFGITKNTNLGRAKNAIALTFLSKFPNLSLKLYDARRRFFTTDFFGDTYKNRNYKIERHIKRGGDDFYSDNGWEFVDSANVIFGYIDRQSNKFVAGFMMKAKDRRKAKTENNNYNHPGNTNPRYKGNNRWGSQPHNYNRNHPNASTNWMGYRPPNGYKKNENRYNPDDIMKANLDVDLDDLATGSVAKNDQQAESSNFQTGTYNSKTKMTKEYRNNHLQQMVTQSYMSKSHSKKTSNWGNNQNNNTQRDNNDTFDEIEDLNKFQTASQEISQPTETQSRANYSTVASSKSSKPASNAWGSQSVSSQKSINVNDPNVSPSRTNSVASSKPSDWAAEDKKN